MNRPVQIHFPARARRGAAWISFLLLFAAFAPAEQPALKEVIVAYKTHFDIGYTDMASKVVDFYRTRMIDAALEVVQETGRLPPEQQFVWTVPGWPMTQILWEGQSAERRRKVMSAYRSGRFATHALPFTTHTESLEPEDLVRGMGFASGLSREAGLELPRDAKMTDVPSHSWILPVILAHAGVEFLHLGCNPASSGPDVPRLFWWEGPDGSRVLTMYSHGSYGSTLKPPADWPYPVWLALIHTGDNHGPPKPEEVEQLLAESRRTLPGVKVRIGRLSDFRDALMKTNPHIPVVRGDMPDTWIHGVMSQPQETRRARNERPRIAALNALDTLLRAWGVDAGPRPAIQKAYENSLLYGEHTWGMDTKRFGERLYGEEWRKARAEGRYQRMEESWSEHGAYSRAVQQVTAPGMQERLTTLARAVNAAGLRVVVFNPVPWTRAGIVEVECGAEGLKDEATGAPVAVERDGAKIRFVARDVPPLGYKTYVKAPPPAGTSIAEERGRVLENRHFKVTVDPEGGSVRSIVEKKSGRELVEPGFGQYLYERFGNADVDAYARAYLDTRMEWGKPDMCRKSLSIPEHRTVPATGLTLKTARGPVTASAVMEGKGIRLEVKLVEAGAYVELVWTAIHKEPDTWPEAGWLSLPVRVKDPAFRLGRPGSVVDPARDLVRGSNHDIYALNTGLAVLERGSGSGVALCPLDSPLVSLGQPGGYHYTKDFQSPRPVIFVNLFNNLFGVNFAQWSSGTWTSRVRIWAVERYGEPLGMVQPSMEARAPLEVAVFDGPPGRLPAQRAGITLSRPGILVTAFGPNPDGPGLLLRLWEQAGTDGTVEVALPDGTRPKAMQPCDLRGRATGAPFPVQNGRFTVQLRHNAPKSLLLVE